MAEPRLPRGVLQAVLDALEEDGWCTIGMDRAVRDGLTAALPVIERAILKRAAQRVLLLEGLANGWRCPACHGKPATAPHAMEGRTGYTCGCGCAWEPVPFVQRDHSMEAGALVRRIARGEPLPELPPEKAAAVRAQLGEDGDHG